MEEKPPQAFEVLLENAKPAVIDVVKGSPEKASVLVAPSGMEVHSLKEFLDEQKEKPDRRTGTHTALDVSTFIEMTNRFKSEDSVVFAKSEVQSNAISAQLLAVLDFHPAGGDNTKAENLDHEVQYNFPISKELKFWMACNANPFDQTDFAILLEEHINEMSASTDGDKAQVANLKPRFADPLEVLSLSRDLEIYSHTKIKQSGRLQSGERKIEFEEAHVDASGKSLTLPDFFVLSIPIFVGGKTERVLVRLRYRPAKEGGVVWFYELYRIDNVFQTAFETITKDVKEKTTLPLYLGSPAE